MHQRINITLPADTLTLIDRVTQKQNRSRFIDAAVRYYIETIGKAKLKQRLKEGALASAQRDLSLAEEYFALDEEGWRAK